MEKRTKQDNSKCRPEIEKLYEIMGLQRKKMAVCNITRSKSKLIKAYNAITLQI